MNKASKNRVAILVFILPALLLFTLLMTIPIFASVYYSLFSWTGIGATRFVDVQNYIQLPLALLLALVLATGVKGENFFRTVYFIPVVISGVIIGVLFLKVYNPDYGLLNTFLDRVGLPGLKRIRLGDTKTALVCAFLPLVWQFIG